MSGDRDIRDALAEALWRMEFPVYSATHSWQHAPEGWRQNALVNADSLLAALPTVSLKIVREG